MTIRTERTNRRTSTNREEWGEHWGVWMVGELKNCWQLGKLGQV